MRFTRLVVPESQLIVQVECYAGHKADERPLRFRLRGRCFEVETVEDRWYSPGVTYFRVIVLGGDRYVLRHDESKNSWTLEAFRAGGDASTGIDRKITRGV